MRSIYNREEESSHYRYVLFVPGQQGTRALEYAPSRCLEEEGRRGQLIGKGGRKLTLKTEPFPPAQTMAFRCVCIAHLVLLVTPLQKWPKRN